MIDRMGAAENRVCNERVMPHSKVTHNLFWTAAGPVNDPKGGPSIAAQFQVFGDSTASANPLNGWVGTPCGSFTPGGQTPQTFFSGTTQPILNTEGTQCHSGASPPANLNLGQGVSYAQLFNIASQQVPGVNPPGNPNQSYLFHKIQGTQANVGGFGSRTPADGPPFLTAQQISDIQTWINNGAQQ